MAYEMVSVVKYIVPSTTSGPVCNAATSGSTYSQTCWSRVTLPRSMSVSGEKRSPATLRPYDGQSPRGIRSSTAGVGAGVP